MHPCQLWHCHGCSWTTRSYRMRLSTWTPTTTPTVCKTTAFWATLSTSFWVQILACLASSFRCFAAEECACASVGSLFHASACSLQGPKWHRSMQMSPKKREATAWLKFLTAWLKFPLHRDMQGLRDHASGLLHLVRYTIDYQSHHFCTVLLKSYIETMGSLYKNHGFW